MSKDKSDNEEDDGSDSDEEEVNSELDKASEYLQQVSGNLNSVLDTDKFTECRMQSLGQCSRFLNRSRGQQGL